MGLQFIKAVSIVDPVVDVTSYSLLRSVLVREKGDSVVNAIWMPPQPSCSFPDTHDRRRRWHCQMYCSCRHAPAIPSQALVNRKSCGVVDHDSRHDGPSISCRALVRENYSGVAGIISMSSALPDDELCGGDDNHLVDNYSNHYGPVIGFSISGERRCPTKTFQSKSHSFNRWHTRLRSIIQGFDLG